MRAKREIGHGLDPIERGSHGAVSPELHGGSALRHSSGGLPDDLIKVTSSLLLSLSCSRSCALQGKQDFGRANAWGEGVLCYCAELAEKQSLEITHLTVLRVT